ncbi:MAG: ABC transporter ATP-binding protein [Granulosicoccus sp.]
MPDQLIEPLVQFKNVVKRFDDFVAVKTMNLDIHEGEFVALMGPSGCGKTTTLRLLAGLEQPSEGQITLAGKLMNDVKAHERETPLVWQSLALFPFLNARENVEFGLKMRGFEPDARRDKAVQWLERLGMGDFIERDVSQLSGGQRQRVALARALVTEPKILLLDEPLSALDAHLVIRMQGVLTKLQRELGITFVYVTHSQSEAFAMADRVVIMGDGDIMQIGSARQIYRTPKNRFVAEFVGRNNILSGTVDTIDADTLNVTTACGKFTVPKPVNRAFKKTDPISFSVSADLVTITADKTDADNCVECNLISEEFVGSVVTLFLEANDGTELKAQVQEKELEKINPKLQIPYYISWPSRSAHVLESET